MQNEELHQAQVEAERSRERYLDLFDYAPVGYFTLDKNAVILEAIAILENNREKDATFLSRCGYLSVCVVNETCLTRKTAL